MVILPVLCWLPVEIQDWARIAIDAQHKCTFDLSETCGTVALTACIALINVLLNPPGGEVNADYGCFEFL